MRMGMVLLVLGAALPFPAAAADWLVDGARQCTQYFPAAEKRHGIPNHLLAAIASTESGRWHSGLGMPVPWPWTINVEGQGRYFNSKAEVIAATSALLRAGKRSIDVGCMQVSLKHHAGAFTSLDQAFDPAHNVNYAAKFLRSNYDDLGDWVKATAAYHSRTPYHGARYLGMIEKTWNRIVSKVQQARGRVGAPAMSTITPQFSKYRSQLASTTVPAAAAGPASRPIASTHGVRVVEVKDAPASRQDVLVIHPGDTSSMKVANAAVTVPDTGPVVVRPTPEGVKRVTIDGGGNASSTVGVSDNKFVFAN